ncbi:CRISPR-associated protein Csn2-St [Companilactobacillus furfuricola]|uniref:CRISPR-associated protein Csn2-St n=1 Tax=Companilactobacillus furfuricola TaxID=1462575 RepID=UPI000F781114|nr:CRISPR-associated protein Csn2-St [Companilactobacillus furfuricola]
MMKIVVNDCEYIEFDFKEINYFVGGNSEELRSILQKFYRYFCNNHGQLENVDDIKIIDGDNPVSIKNTNIIFIQGIQSIVDQLLYKKNSLLFNQFNRMSSDFELVRDLDNLNDVQMKLSIDLQEKINTVSKKLFVGLNDFTFDHVVKHNLQLAIKSADNLFALEYSSLDDLMDLYIDFLDEQLSFSDKPSWVVLYNLDAFLSHYSKTKLMSQIHLWIKLYDLKIIYIGGTLENCYINSDEIGNIIVSAEEFHSILPFDNLVKSIKMRYPNEMKMSETKLLSSLIRVIPKMGTSQLDYISGKDLVLLKVLDDMIGFKVSFNQEDFVLSNAEISYLEN